MKKISVLGVILAIFMIVFGAIFPMPEKDIYIGYISESSWLKDDGTKYINGDAYNYLIEASLKGGWVSGVMALKTICITSGIILFILSLSHNEKVKILEEQTYYLSTITKNTSESNNGEEVKSETANNSLPPM